MMVKIKIKRKTKSVHNTPKCEIERLCFLILIRWVGY